MSWFKREDGEYESGPGPALTAGSGEKNVRTEGLWIKCLGCRQAIFKADLEANLNVCPKCQHHFKIGARQRIELLLEPGYELVDEGLRSTDPLNFTDVKPYKQRLRKAQEANRAERRNSERGGEAWAAPGGGERDGVRLHRRLDGRGGGRDDCPRRGSRPAGHASR